MDGAASAVAASGVAAPPSIAAASAPCSGAEFEVDPEAPEHPVNSPSVTTTMPRALTGTL
jgi:hypothetical protein